MSYVALYRAYRPQTFDEVSGQKAIIQTLRNAIKLNKVSHAYLFAGPRGTGKTTLAKIMAKALCCEDGPNDNFDNNSPICQGITKGSIADVVEIDAASNNGVDDIRNLRDNVKFLPSTCRYKIYIIDEAHMLTDQAWNALLKTLEEPPTYVIFILATTEPHTIPATILSRCQRFDFQGLETGEISERLKEVSKSENINITDEAIEVISELAEGGMRDALSLLDASISYSGDIVEASDVLEVSGNVSDTDILNILYEIYNNNGSVALDNLSSILKQGKEISKVIADFISFLRNVLLYKIGKIKSDKAIYKNSTYISFSKSISTNLVYTYLTLLNDCLINIKYTNQKKAFLEVCILKMADKNTVDYEALLSRIDRLEEELKNIKHVNQKPSGPIFSSDLELNLDIPYVDTTNSQTNNFDYSNCIKSSELNLVLNNGDKLLRNEVGKILVEIKKDIPLLNNANIVCVSNESIIITLPTEGTCNRFMKDPNYTNVLKRFNINNYKFSNLYFINTSMWEEVFKDYLDKFKAGDKKPVLDNHNIKIFKYVKQEVLKPYDPLEEFFDN